MKDSHTGKTFYGYGGSDRVAKIGTILPAGAPQEWENPAVLFDAIEQYETAGNARTAKKIILALPREFDITQAQEVVEEYIRETLTSKGYAAVYAIHTDKDGNNPHVHILAPNRQIDSKSRTWAKNKTRKTYALDELGRRIPLTDPKTGIQKLGKRNEKLWKRVTVEQNQLDQKQMHQELRETWAQCCNWYLTQDNQIDHRSNASRGIDFKPTIHEGYAARQMGERSHRVQYNKKIMEYNRQLAEKSNAPDLLVALQEKILEGKKTGYARWASGFNLKQTVKTYNWLTEHRITYENLSQRLQKAEKGLSTLLVKIGAADQRMADIEALRASIRDYVETRGIYVAYRKTGYSKKFLTEHESEISANKAARQHFDQLGLKKLPTMKTLQAEHDRLAAQRKSDYAEYQAIRAEVKELWTVKANLDQVLGQDPGKPQRDTRWQPNKDQER